MDVPQGETHQGLTRVGSLRWVIKSFVKGDPRWWSRNGGPPTWDHRRGVDEAVPQAWYCKGDPLMGVLHEGFQNGGPTSGFPTSGSKISTKRFPQRRSPKVIPGSRVPGGPARGTPNCVPLRGVSQPGSQKGVTECVVSKGGPQNRVPKWGPQWGVQKWVQQMCPPREVTKGDPTIGSNKRVPSRAVPEGGSRKRGPQWYVPQRRSHKVGTPRCVTQRCSPTRGPQKGSATRVPQLRTQDFPQWCPPGWGPSWVVRKR
jgi:hypothetical protein